MADSCCDQKSDELTELGERQRVVLWVALAINAVLFVVEFGVGWWARSTALLADSLDMLGDSFVYAFSLWVLHRCRGWSARASLSKGIVQLVFGIVVLAQAGWRAWDGTPPAADAMALMGVVALAGNACVFALLWAHRSDDINMTSTWLCSRNDLIANTGVLFAAGSVWLLDSVWPDVIVGGAIAVLFLQTARGIIRDARVELSQHDGIDRVAV
ncbi:MAG: cation transporter [Ilumatobacter sp.]